MGLDPCGVRTCADTDSVGWRLRLFILAPFGDACLRSFLLNTLDRPPQGSNTKTKEAGNNNLPGWQTAAPGGVPCVFASRTPWPSQLPAGLGPAEAMLLHYSRNAEPAPRRARPGGSRASAPQSERRTSSPPGSARRKPCFCTTVGTPNQLPAGSGTTDARSAAAMVPHEPPTQTKSLPPNHSPALHSSAPKPHPKPLRLGFGWAVQVFQFFAASPRPRPAGDYSLRVSYVMPSRFRRLARLIVDSHRPPL